MADKKLNIKVGLKGAKKAEKGLGKVNSSMKSMAKSALVAGGSFFAVQGIIRGFSAVIKLAGEQQKAEKKLETALGHTSKALLNQASAFQKQSKHGDETIISMMALASNMGIAEDKIGETTKMAIGLSEALGVDLNMAMKAAAGAIQGDTNMLTRYIPELKTTKDATEKLEIVQRAANKGFEQSIKSTETMAGSMTQAGMAMGDAGEQLGSFLAPAVTNISNWFSSAATSAGEFFQRATETSLETSIRELQSLGVNTLNLELAFSKAESAKAKYMAVGLRGEEEISKNLNQNSMLRAELLEKQANLQIKLLESGTSQEDLEATALASKWSIYGVGVTTLAVEASARLENLKLLELELLGLEKQSGLDQAELEIVQKQKAAKEQVLALEKAIEESKNNQADIPKTESKDEEKIVELKKKKQELVIQELKQAALVQGSAKDAMKAVVRAESMEAVAGYISSVLKNVPFPANLILAAGGGALVSGLLDSGLSKFAQGGIVQGQGSGDTVPAMLTPGEVILNQAQQSNLVGGMGGVTINVSAPLVDETILDTIIPAIEKAHRMNLA